MLVQTYEGKTITEWALLTKDLESRLAQAHARIDQVEGWLEDKCIDIDRLRQELALETEHLGQCCRNIAKLRQRVGELEQLRQAVTGEIELHDVPDYELWYASIEDGIVQKDFYVWYAERLRQARP